MALSVSIVADSKFPVDRKRLRSAVASAWEKYGVGGEGSVSVAVVGSRKMAELATRYLGKEEATDVLAFPQQEASRDAHGFIAPRDLPLELGDIIICFPLALEQAAEDGVFVDDRIEALALHGLRNLLGMEDEQLKT